jgi:hypothetical protein
MKPRRCLSLLASFILVAIIFCAPFSTLAPQSQARSNPDAGLIASAERKLQHLESNGAQSAPDPAPTEFTEAEVNAYVASGNVKLPVGVQSVTFQEQPQIVIGTSRVDFDQLKAGKNSYNPLLSVFSGVHDVVVTAHARGEHGQGLVHVDSVSLDGVDVPQFALQLFVEKFLKPRYPDVGIDSRFALPDRVDTVVVGLHKISVTQK